MYKPCREEPKHIGSNVCQKWVVAVRRPGRVIDTPSLGVPWYEVDPLYHRIHL